MANHIPDPFEQEESHLHLEDFQQDLYEESNADRRFVNYIVDSIGYYLVLIVVSFFMFFLTDLFGGVSESIGVFLFFASWIFYYWGLEYWFGKTLGKLLTRTRVVREDGGKPTASQIFVRTLCRLVPFEPFSFLASHKGWHDRWSGTKVVMDLKK